MKVVPKIWISFLAVLFVLVGSYPQFAQAEYVDECLEQPELCDEEIVPQENESNEEALLQEDSGGSLVFELVKLFFALILVVGLIYAFLFFLKRNNRLGPRLSNLESIGGISLGQNKSIQLIRLGNRIFVVGVGEEISLLDEVKDEELIHEIIKQKEAQDQEFDAGKILNTLLPKKKKDKETFNNLFQQELNRMEKNRKSILDKRKED